MNFASLDIEEAEQLYKKGVHSGKIQAINELFYYLSQNIHKDNKKSVFAMILDFKKLKGLTINGN